MRFFKKMVQGPSPNHSWTNKNLSMGNTLRSKSSRSGGKSSKRQSSRIRMKPPMSSQKPETNLSSLLDTPNPMTATGSSNYTDHSPVNSYENRNNRGNFDTFAPNNEVEMVNVSANYNRESPPNSKASGSRSRARRNYNQGLYYREYSNSSRKNMISPKQKAMLGGKSQSEVIVTNQPIPDGTIFIAKTGSHEEKMVVLREEYYQTLVRQIEQDYSKSLKAKKLGSRRTNSMERSTFRSSHKGIGIKSDRLHNAQKKSEVQDFTQIYRPNSKSYSKLNIPQRNRDSPSITTRLKNKRSNSEKILRVHQNFSDRKLASTQKLRKTGGSSFVRKTRTQFLRDISLQKKLERLNQISHTPSRIHSTKRKVSVPIFDNESRKRGRKQVTAIRNGKFVILSPAKGKISTSRSGKKYSPRLNNKRCKSESYLHTTQRRFQGIHRLKKHNQFEPQTKKSRKKKKRKKIILVDAPNDPSRVISRKLNVTPVNEPSMMKIIDKRKGSHQMSPQDGDKQGIVFDSMNNELKLNSKYEHMFMGKGIDQIDRPSEQIIQEFVRKAKIKPSLSPTRKKKKRRAKANEIIYEEGYPKPHKKKTKSKRKRKMRQIIVPECANPHRMTVTQKARLQANLRRIEQMKEREEKRLGSRHWEKHFLKKTEESLDLGLNDPKYLQNVEENLPLHTEDPHYDEIRGYYLEKGRQPTHSRTPTRNKMRKKRKPAVILDIANSKTGIPKMYETNSVENSKKLDELSVSEYKKSTKKKKSPKKKTPMRTKKRVSKGGKTKKARVPKSPKKKSKSPLNKIIVNQSDSRISSGTGDREAHNNSYQENARLLRIEPIEEDILDTISPRPSRKKSSSRLRSKKSSKVTSKNVTPARSRISQKSQRSANGVPRLDISRSKSKSRASSRGTIQKHPKKLTKKVKKKKKVIKKKKKFKTSEKSRARKERLKNQLLMIEKRRNEEVENLNALATSRSREYFSGQGAVNLKLPGRGSNSFLPQPQLDLNFEFSRVETDGNLPSAGMNRSPLIGEDVCEDEIILEEPSHSQFGACDIATIKVRIDEIKPPAKGIFSNRLTFAEVDSVVNCDFTPIDEIESKEHTSSPAVKCESVADIMAAIKSFQPTMEGQNPGLNSKKASFIDTGTIQSDKASTQHGFSRQESTIQDYILDDDDDEFDPNDDDDDFDPNDDDSLNCNEDNENLLSHTQTPAKTKSLSGSKICQVTENSEDLLKDNETYDVDDQTYLEDFSGIDSLQVDISKNKSRMLSEAGINHLATQESKPDASFDIAIGSKKIVLDDKNGTERQFFEDYEVIKDQQNDQSGLNNSSLLYNSFISEMLVFHLCN